jgi:hypothetical protein
MKYYVNKAHQSLIIDFNDSAEQDSANMAKMFEDSGSASPRKPSPVTENTVDEESRVILNYILFVEMNNLSASYSLWLVIG